MNLWEREPSSLRLAQKRRQTAWDDDYPANVMFRIYTRSPWALLGKGCIFSDS